GIDGGEDHAVLELLHAGRPVSSRPGARRRQGSGRRAPAARGARPVSEWTEHVSTSKGGGRWGYPGTGVGALVPATGLPARGAGGEGAAGGGSPPAVSGVGGRRGRCRGSRGAAPARPPALRTAAPRAPGPGSTVRTRPRGRRPRRSGAGRSTPPRRTARSSA